MHVVRPAGEWRLTTAEILYRLPDHPGLLQTFVWQEFDLAPHFPGLRRFLAFWRRELDGPVHSVRVAAAEPLAGRRWCHADHLLTLQ
ncbi:MAG: usg protein [Acetobacteraceae bacterium]